MAERRKAKKKGQDPQPSQSAEIKPTKLEYDVAQYMKKNVTTKKTKFLSHQVNYFNANKAVDLLLDSPWASGSEVIFTDRTSVVKFCNKLLQHKFFHRAKKVAVTDKDLRPKELKKKKEKDDKQLKKKEENEDSKHEEQSNTEQEEPKEKDKKKRTKIKLDMHLNQVFVDGPEAYVWMYDPIPFWYYIAGACLLFAAIAVCLFPLWPPTVRQGVYYLSIAAAGFLGVILGLAVLRFIIFSIIWTLSLGRHHFWILPNLTEDVGFFASFWPLYFYEYKGACGSPKKKSKKDSQSNNETEKQIQKSDAEEAVDSQSAAETDADKNLEASQEGSQDNSDSENSNANSQNFVLLDKDEIEDEED